MGFAQITQIFSFVLFVPDLASDGQSLLVILDGLASLAQPGVGQPQVAQVGSFAPSVPDLA